MALIKSLSDQLNSQKYEMSYLHDDLVKAFSGLTKLVKTQGQEIAELTNELNSLRKAGKGAQSVMIAKSEPTLSNQDLMAKAFMAKSKGAINSKELGELDVSLRQGAIIDPALLNKIQSI